VKTSSILIEAGKRASVNRPNSHIPFVCLLNLMQDFGKFYHKRTAPHVSENGFYFLFQKSLKLFWLKRDVQVFSLAVSHKKLT